ncbi:putative mitochondrial protein AtMg00820 [Silene latifolia]|uniref:putative mitochondrial protein AtMg00820 n=1 Tax=Silene latifolia TaxID=37657 RepID=UPI003D779DDE
MSTRAMHGIFKPKALTATHSISPIPKSPKAALDDPNWKRAMTDEFTALKDNHTWDLVPKPTDASVIRCLWLYRHKFHAAGTLQRYKARLVVNSKAQQVGIDCDETFSPVVKPTTIRTVLSLAITRS